MRSRPVSVASVRILNRISGDTDVNQESTDSDAC